MAPDRDDRSGAPDPDVDALFAQIVAGWDDEQTSPVPPWPATEDLPDRPRPTDRRDDGTDDPPTPRRRETDRREGDRPDGLQPGRHQGRDEDSPAEGRDPDGRRSAGGAPGDGERRRPGRHARDDGDRDRPRTSGAPPSRPLPPAPPPADRASSHGTPTYQPTGDAEPGDRSGGPVAPGPRDWEAAEADDRYVPPEPPPLPRGDLVGRLAWAGVLLGPAFLLLSALVWGDAGPFPLAVAALAFVGGFVTLVARMPARRDDDDDDGAVV